MADIRESLIGIVASAPGLSARNIAYELHRRGFLDVERRTVNQILYSLNSPFYRSINSKGIPVWFVKKTSTIQREVPASFDQEAYWMKALKLFPWQQRAYQSWKQAGYHGVVEAVTGTGKTRIATAAIGIHVCQGWRVAVIVPSISLLDQWHKVIKQEVDSKLKAPLTISLMGGGHARRTDYPHVTICVAPTAAKRDFLTDERKGLLIADECHHYGAPNWSEALKSHFDRRLGLTATYERADNGVEKYLDPYFGGVCYSLDYEEALRDDVLANFKIAFIGVQFSNHEKYRYEEHDEQCRDTRKALINKHHLPAEPFGDFISEANALAQSNEGEATFLARRYLFNFSRRREIMASAQNKHFRLQEIREAISNSDKTILFTQTKSAAHTAVDTLNSLGIKGAVLDADMDLSERKKVLIGFEDGEHELVAAPLLLDEGVDVPAADLAIVLAASRSRKQMIQRMGRVLRKKKDQRLARIAIFFVENSSEDPRLGAHETFVNLIIRAASEIRTFRSTDNPREMCRYLSPSNSARATDKDNEVPF